MCLIIMEDIWNLQNTERHSTKDDTIMFYSSLASIYVGFCLVSCWIATNASSPFTVKSFILFYLVHNSSSLVFPFL